MVTKRCRAALRSGEREVEEEDEEREDFAAPAIMTLEIERERIFKFNF